VRLAALLAASSHARAIGIYLPTGAGFVITAYAAWRAGFAILPLNLLLPAESLSYVIEHAELELHDVPRVPFGHAIAPGDPPQAPGRRTVRKPAWMAPTRSPAPLPTT